MSEQLPLSDADNEAIGESIVTRLLVYASITLITYSVLSNTITIPFFVIDDSDAINKALSYWKNISSGNILKLFDRDISGNRFWPGFTLYLVLRAWLFGTSSILWHLWQVTLYAIAGVCLVYIGRKLSGSYFPGGFAHLLLLVTGTADYQSNWFNYIFTNSFEPLIYLLWAGAALMTSVALAMRSRRGSVTLMILAVALMIWSMTVKETVAPAILLFVPILLLLYKVRRGNEQVEIPRQVMIGGVVMLCFAAGWLVLLLFMIRRGSEYATTGTLLLNPVAWLQGLRDYGGFWIESTHLLFPAALLHYLARLAGRRKMTGPDVTQGLLFWCAFCQVVPLVVWPERSMRLSQPGYAFALLAACIEWYRFLEILQKSTSAESSRQPAAALVRLAGLATILFMLCGKQLLGLQVFSLSLRLLFYLWGVAIIVMLYMSYRKELVPARWLRSVSLLYGCWIAIVLIHLVAVNLSSYMATYEVREGLRHKMVSYISRSAPRGARVSWLVPPGGEIFAWSAAIHSRLFFDRNDLVQGPHTFVAQQGALRKGDLIVAYGLPTSRSPQGQGSLLRKAIEVSGRQAPAQSLHELEKLVIDLVIPPFRLPRERQEIKELKTQTAIYSVASESWSFDPEFEKRLGGTGGRK